MPDERKMRLADLLEKVVEGQIEAVDALREVMNWPDIPSDRNDVNAALTTLMQVHIYRDARESDPELDENLRNRLRLDVAQLRS